MTKDLKEKAIDIKGKQYVQVADRILYFNDAYKDGCIVTEMVRYENKHIIMHAKAYPEGLEGRFFSGYAQEIEGEGYINKTSALENAETSAVGRALAMMGIGVIDSIASIDEINKATNRTKQPVADAVLMKIGEAKTTEQLHEVWKSLSGELQDQYAETFKNAKIKLIKPIKSN